MPDCLQPVFLEDLGRNSTLFLLQDLGSGIARSGLWDYNISDLGFPYLGSEDLGSCHTWDTTPSSISRKISLFLKDLGHYSTLFLLQDMRPGFSQELGKCLKYLGYWSIPFPWPAFHEISNVFHCSHARAIPHQKDL